MVKTLAGKTLGLLLTTSPERADLNSAVQLARAAMGLGAEARLFVMCDGVYALGEKALKELAAEGARVTVCGHNAEQRRVEEITDEPNIEWGSQYDLAQMSEECDRIVAFN